MIEPEGGPFDAEAHVLMTYRTRVVPWCASRAFLAERIGLHRAFYLCATQHELEGDRGVIERVDDASIVSMAQEVASVRLELEHAEGRIVLEGEPLEGKTWRFSRSASEQGRS